MNELSLFSGAGGGLLATKHLLGWKTIGYVEIDEYCQAVLAQRIMDGYLDPAPIFGDIRRFIEDGYAEAYQGMVDVITGGFPCQDISCAGAGDGLEGQRSGLWEQMAKVVCQVKPRYVFVENSPMLVVRGLGTVLKDLAQAGYNAKWAVLSCADAGGPHLRERIWIVADNNSQRGGFLSKRKHPEIRDMGNNQENRPFSYWNGIRFEGKASLSNKRSAYPPLICRVDDGIPDRVDRLKAIGNGQVPLVAATAWQILTNSNQG